MALKSGIFSYKMYTHTNTLTNTHERVNDAAHSQMKHRSDRQTDTLINLRTNE